LTPRTGLAIASLILGIVGLCLSLVLVGGLLGILGLALGLVHIRGRRGPTAMAWCGVVFSILGIAASVVLGFFYFRTVLAMKGTMASMQSGMETASGWEGVLAPDITVTNLEGKAIRLGDLKGKRVVLDFWATWRGPCVKEIPEFIRLQNEAPRDELVIIGISDESAPTLKPFVKEKAVNYSIASAKGLPEPFGNLTEFPTTFFIDRKGVIQSVSVGAQSFTALKKAALAGDYQGLPQSKPAAQPAAAVKDADKMLQPVLVWSNNLPGATALCSGDWDGGGAAEILVATGTKLHVLNLEGQEKSAVMLPAVYSMMECGRHSQKGPRLLGYSNWGRRLDVVDKTGKELWNFSSMMGVDGAHWADLDGNGTDELIVGMNGFGGLEALSADGRKMWQVSMGNVWGQAAVPPGPAGQALVFATEASGSVRVFDGKGHPVRTLRPNGDYCTGLAAAVMDRSSRVQIVAVGQPRSTGISEAIAFDPSGSVAWSAPVNSAGAGVLAHIASGDVLGDGTLVWTFLQPSGDLILVNADGEKLAAIPKQAATTEFVIVPGTNAPGMLVVLNGAWVRAYSFK